MSTQIADSIDDAWPSDSCACWSGIMWTVLPAWVQNAVSFFMPSCPSRCEQRYARPRRPGVGGIERITPGIPPSGKPLQPSHGRRRLARGPFGTIANATQHRPLHDEVRRLEHEHVER